MTRNRLVVTATTTCWVATYEGPHAAEIEDLFEATTLPLPFAQHYPVDAILKELAASHPGVDVILADGDRDASAYQRKVRCNEV